jgi:hypothetical protein
MSFGTAHADVRGRVLRSRFSASYGKSHDELVDDLRVLANLGARLYDNLFDEAYLTMSGQLRAEAAGRGRPPILQVVGLSERTMAIPWALVYDLPVGGNPADYATTISPPLPTATTCGCGSARTPSPRPT